LQHAIPRRNFQKKESISLYWELFLINDFIFFFYLFGCSSQFMCITINFTVH
jgi:hypothetical protein